MIVPITLFVLGQAAPSEARQFDFWVGEWDCVGRLSQGAGKWTETKARNTVRRILGGRVVEENFRMTGLVGRSHSVYNPQRKVWQQTWVDDSGSYIALSGGMQGKEMVLRTLPNPATPERGNRMVFADITPKAFRWRWEATTDGGKTWTLQWELNYRRRAR